MGAVNYCNGNVITLAHEIYYPSDEDLKEYRAVNDWDDEELSDEELFNAFLEDERCFCEEEFDEIEKEINAFVRSTGLNNESCDYLSISIDYGYYEGFAVTVDFYYNEKREEVFFWDYDEKMTVYRQSQQVEEFILHLLDNYNLQEGDSWWVSTWNNYDDSKKNIKKNFIELRKNIKTVPCYSYAKRHGLLAAK